MAKHSFARYYQQLISNGLISRADWKKMFSEEFFKYIPTFFQIALEVLRYLPKCLMISLAPSSVRALGNSGEHKKLVRLVEALTNSSV